MQVPFLDLKAQYSSIKNEVNSAIQNVLENCSFILGPQVEDFEKSFAAMHNVKHCIGLSSGTDGNHAVLWALGINREDEVIIPANTFIATAWGAVLNGARPVFIDCEPDSYNINPEMLESAISQKTKAIVAVHLYGQPADLDPIKRIADKYGIYLVEDCAQAHLSEYKGRKVGGLSRAASFSYFPGKNLGAYGEAGSVTTNSDFVAETVRMLRQHGSLEKYDHIIYGQNYRMEALQAAVLNVKLKYIEQWTDKRRKAAASYCELLGDVEEIKLPREMPYAKHVYHLFVIRLKTKIRGQRDSLVNFLNDNRIATGLHYPIPLHLQKCFRHLGYKKGDFPISEDLADFGVSLPIYPELSCGQIEYVCGKIRSFFAKEKTIINWKTTLSTE